jgi:hypothetical protein
VDSARTDGYHSTAYMEATPWVLRSEMIRRKRVRARRPGGGTHGRLSASTRPPENADISEIMGRLSDAIFVVATAANALLGAQEREGSTAGAEVGDEITTLLHGVRCVRRAYDALDVALGEVRTWALNGSDRGRGGQLSKAIRRHLDVAREHVFWASGIVDCGAYATESKLLPRTAGSALSKHSRLRTLCLRKLRQSDWTFLMTSWIRKVSHEPGSRRVHQHAGCGASVRAMGSRAAVLRRFPVHRGL